MDVYANNLKYKIFDYVFLHGNNTNDKCKVNYGIFANSSFLNNTKLFNNSHLYLISALLVLHDFETDMVLSSYSIIRFN